MVTLPICRDAVPIEVRWAKASSDAGMEVVALVDDDDVRARTEVIQTQQRANVRTGRAVVGAAVSAVAVVVGVGPNKTSTTRQRAEHNQCQHGKDNEPGNCSLHGKLLTGGNSAIGQNRQSVRSMF